MVTKPIVQTLQQHIHLYQESIKHNVLVCVEVHKRFDPIYIDARDVIQQSLGAFSYIYSYMSQPKSQLDTFAAWLGNTPPNGSNGGTGVTGGTGGNSGGGNNTQSKSSDISYYLNSHHIDFHEFCMENKGRPVSVVANASYGIANERLHTTGCEDTITLLVTWENIEVVPAQDTSSSTTSTDDAVPRNSRRQIIGQFNNSFVAVKSVGTAVYTASWVAPKSDVHSQQRFFYMGEV